jgi:glycosyltransferase involved in cell wall biosynthesis
MADPRITIIMPALNEEANIQSAIRDTLTAFEDYHVAGEVLVINDGSTDRTAEVVAGEMERDPRVRVLHHARRRGIGASFWDGVAHAKGEMVCMLPGDNENDPWEILQYHALLDHVDILVPFVFNKRARSLFRNGLSFAYRFIINTTFGVYFNYTNGTVAYRRQILQELDYHSDGFFFQTDILIRLVKRGYLFAEVPYRLNQREHGVSKAVSFPSLLQVMRGYLRLFRDVRFQRHETGQFAKESQTARRQEGSVRLSHQQALS